MKDNINPIEYYKVTLKSGAHSVFANDNRFEDYTDRLVSGIYSITTSTEVMPINLETVAEIRKVEACEYCEKEVNQSGSFDCPHCGKRIFIPVHENNPQ